MLLKFFVRKCKKKPDLDKEFKQRLGIAGVLSGEFVWYTRGDEELGIPELQIDLVIERRIPD